VNVASAIEGESVAGVGVEWRGVVYLSFSEARERCRLSRYRFRKLVQQHGLQKFRRLGENRQYVRLADLEAVGRLSRAS
jgi:hypothetical protein